MCYLGWSLLAVSCQAFLVLHEPGRVWAKIVFFWFIGGSIPPVLPMVVEYPGIYANRVNQMKK